MHYLGQHRSWRGELYGSRDYAAQFTLLTHYNLQNYSASCIIVLHFLTYFISQYFLDQIQP